MTSPIKLWIDALRSGDYKQTVGVLRDDDGYCCLGVACHLAVKAGVIPPPIADQNPEDEPERYSYAGEVADLPIEVRDWLDPSPNLLIEGECSGANLASMNDDGASFDDIADALQQRLEEIC